MLDTTLGPGSVVWNGSHYKTILETAATGGAMSIVDSVTPPGMGPPRHVHHAEDEAFVVLSGECEFWVAGRRWTAGPGETAFVPRGTEHTFRVIGTQPSRHLIILTPGGFEQFFHEMAEGRCRIPEDMETVVESGRRHNLDFTGPPLEDEA